MAARLDIDERLYQLREIRDQGDLQRIREAAIKGLSDSSNLIIAEAAKLIGNNEFTDAQPVLIATWNRLFQHTDPIKVDRGCWAKAAIIEALGKLDYDEPDFYLAALQYKQLEPAWGGTVDTAENVRGGSAFALARSQQIRAVDKLNTFVNLLLQSSKADRSNAARAIADTGNEFAIPLLRLKLMSGDSETEVLGACMSALLRISLPSIPLVAQFLSHPTENIVLEAAAALGECGKPEAVNALIATWNRTGDEGIRRSLLLSIGLSRDKLAIDFLISRLESTGDGEAALEALKPACVYEENRNRIRQVLDQLSDKTLKAAFDRKFSRES